MSDLTKRQRQILEFISVSTQEKGFPPSVREICDAVGLSSTATVYSHLMGLQEKGYLRRDESKPRALEVVLDADTAVEIERRPVRYVPLVGDVAAGTGVLAAENIEDQVPLPDEFVGKGPHFMLRVRGDSMIEAGILDGDYIVVHQQSEARGGDIVVASLPDGEATVKSIYFRGDWIILRPHNSEYEDMPFDAKDVTIYGKVVSVLRRL